MDRNDTHVWAYSNTGTRAHAFLRTAEDGRLVAACRKTTTREASALMYPAEAFSELTRCGICEKAHRSYLARVESSMAPATESDDLGYVHTEQPQADVTVETVDSVETAHTPAAETVAELIEQIATVLDEQDAKWVAARTTEDGENIALEALQLIRELITPAAIEKPAGVPVDAKCVRCSEGIVKLAQPYRTRGGFVSEWAARSNGIPWCQGVGSQMTAHTDVQRCDVCGTTEHKGRAFYENCYGDLLCWPCADGKRPGPAGTPASRLLERLAQQSATL